MGYRRWHKVHEPRFVSKLHVTSKATKQTNETNERTNDQTEFSSMRRRSSMENCRKLWQMTEGGKYVYKAKKIHKRKSDFIYCVCCLTTARHGQWERVRRSVWRVRFNSEAPISAIYTFFPPNGKKWSFHAGARSLLHINKRTRPPVIRNWIEIETNEHTKPNSSSSSSREKIQLENLYEANSVHVMLSKYIHRLKTRASHLYSIQHTLAHTLALTRSIGPVRSRSRLCCFHFTIPYHTIRYDVYAVQWKGFVCALCRTTLL